MPPKTRRSACLPNVLSDDLLLCLLSELTPEAMHAASLVSHTWREQSKAAGLLCHLVGSTPGRRHHRFLGPYIMRKDLVHGRFSYVLLGDPGKMIWYDGDGCWFAGISSEVGQSRGRFVVQDYAASPWTITEPWEIRGIETSWEIAPSIRCGIDAAAADAAYALAKDAAWELQAAANVVHITNDGPAMAPLHARFMGAYVRIADRLVNWRPAYIKRRAAKFALWYDGRCWVAGFTKNLGRDTGFVVAQDDAIAPECVAVNWQILIEQEWPDAPTLRCAADELEAVSPRSTRRRSQRLSS